MLRLKYLDSMSQYNTYTNLINLEKQKFQAEEAKIQEYVAEMREYAAKINELQEKTKEHQENEKRIENKIRQLEEMRSDEPEPAPTMNTHDRLPACVREVIMFNNINSLSDFNNFCGNRARGRGIDRSAIYDAAMSIFTGNLADYEDPEAVIRNSYEVMPWWP